jgi:hypothetical protein
VSENGVAEMKFTNKDTNIFIDIYFYDDLWAHYLACSHCRPQPLTFETCFGGDEHGVDNLTCVVYLNLPSQIVTRLFKKERNCEQKQNEMREREVDAGSVSRF